MITQAYILCGGLGTRLGSMVKDTPKPMLPVGGKPILQHTMELLRKQGFTKAIIVAGYKADVVKEFFEDKDWGLDVEVFIEPGRLGTAGAMPLLKDKLDDNFLVVYGDVFIDFDARAMCDEHEKQEAMVSILARPSTHPWSADLIQTDKQGLITEIVAKADLDSNKGYLNMGNAAIYTMNKSILKHIPTEEKAEFMEEVFPRAIKAGEPFRVYQLDPGQFIRDMGKPERFQIVENYLKDRADIEQARNNPKPIKCVFLDRDGVINKEVNLLHKVKDMEILPGVPEAMKLFNDNNIKVVVITNQPVIARGKLTEEGFAEIMKAIKDGLQGASWDTMYYCPHHPETQWNEGVEKLRRGCDCRKPAIGMIMKARKENNLDLAECVMIGDSFRDVEMGKNAGLRTIFIDSGAGAIKEGMNPNATFKSLLEAAQAIVGGKL